MPASHRATARRYPALGPVPALVSALLLGGLASASLAQTQVVRPPVAQYWMDVSTLRIAGMDEMPTPGERASLGATPGRRLDVAVATQRKPAGTQATQTIPAGMAMGSSLVLLPAPPAKSTTPNPPTPQDDANAEMPDKPRGRILMYWGCGETVRSGQPRILDAANARPEDYAQFMRGRATRERGATAALGHAVWPNAQNTQRIPATASLQGDHAVRGDGIPAGLQFTLGPAQDFLPPLDLSASGTRAQATTLRWTAQAQARAYFLNAMGGSGDDMVVWSSAETPEPGWGLMDYLSPANLSQWLGDKTLLPASQTECAIPSGIFAKSDGAMVQGIAYGQELNLIHPQRPLNKKVAWTPDWSAQVRVKSITMLPLERDTQVSNTDRKRAKSPTNPSSGPEMPDDGTDQKGLLPVVPALPGIPGLGEALKGLFGR
jgi:hypothetical protein